jgi:hypothetical protein
MVEFLLIFLICSIYFGGKELLKYMAQRDYERRKFYLLVQQELDRMDKATEDLKYEQNRMDYKKWAGRN